MSESLIWCSKEANSSLIRNSSDVDPLWYLNRFGYLDTTSSKKSANLIMVPSENSTNPIVTTAIKKFQKFAGLNQTGVIDEDTKKMMTTPRCGHPDKLGDDQKNRNRRYALQGSKWPKSNIQFKITKYPAYRLMSKRDINDELKRAFDLWSVNSNLEFELVDEIGNKSISKLILPESDKNKSKTNDVDIEIRFESGYHGDSEPFDGSGMILGHAYFPEFGGSTHFDADEFWTKNSTNGVNLYQVAVHEFGHALGLEHSENFDAIMAPFFRGYTTDFKLHSDDLTGIEMLYGPNKKPKKQPKIIPNFRNNMPNVYKNELNFDLSNKNINYRIINEYFDPSSTISLCLDGKNGLTYMNLPSKLDSVLYVPENALTYFFKNNLYWRSSKLYELDPGYPRLISDSFRGLNSKNGFNGRIDASFVWSGNRRVYFIEGHKYWRFDFESGSVEPGYPKSLSVWRGLPSKITSAFLFNDLAFKVEEDAFPPYPRLNKDFWFGCNNLNRFGKLILNSTLNEAKKNNVEINQTNREEEAEPRSKLEKQKSNISNRLDTDFCLIFSFFLIEYLEEY
ncbi:matrix metallo ase-14-like [Brachionus plicatilis]|uniref:Matrix metallo ase-14-like n=1 Tax=Brachionus plicatilis TaxID=10195 RepID=A0A3M7R8W8_BRAPC|nr:matrix metallo ase-14-like [Brachionus plicatilis]